MQERNIDWQKYLIVFCITALLFVLAGYLSNHFSNKKISELQTIQDKIAIDILSSETQFSLLSDLSCKNVSGSLLSGELEDLGHKLEWSDQNLDDDDTLLYLKNYYFLLEIKDYLLMKKISERCRTKAAFVLYFYTTKENCDECDKQGLVLSTLREKYPELRVYSFDFSTALSAVRAMTDIYKIKDNQIPALVIEGDVLTGFRGIEELDSILTRSFKLKESTSETVDDL